MPATLDSIVKKEEYIQYTAYGILVVYSYGLLARVFRVPVLRSAWNHTRYYSSTGSRSTVQVRALENGSQIHKTDAYRIFFPVLIGVQLEVRILLMISLLQQFLGMLFVLILVILHSVALCLPPSTSFKTMADIGGAINEKARNVTSTRTESSQSNAFSRKSMAHLLHALEGLDRYPNYLNRWNERDMDELELSLEDQLEEVRQQRRTIRARRTAVKQLTGSLVPITLRQPTSWEQVRLLLDPSFEKTLFQSRQFRKQPPSLEQVLSGEKAVQLDTHLLETLMEQEVYDVYSLPLFRPTFCDEIRRYIQSISKLGDVSLHMGTRPIDLDNIGLSWVNDLLLNLVARPISRHLYKDTECGGKDLDWRHGYVASYTATSDTRNRLVAHTDDSEVTLNIGLGVDFLGGLLEFSGLRGEGDQELLGDYEPIKGRAILHAGRHFHQVSRVSRGDRFALILWARSWNGIRAQTCPCCWLNRRHDNTCVCGSRWN